MKKLLHIIASPRGEESRTLQIAGAFLDSFRESHPEWLVDELDLSTEALPSLSIKLVSGKYVLLEGKDLHGYLKEAWAEILQHINRFKSADCYLISCPMWNFHVPYMLKHYIDLIVQPKYLFHYKKDGGVEGLVHGKKMVVISTRGGQYGGAMEKFDHQESYLRAIFGFVGIEEIDFIKAEPMDMGIELQKQKILEAETKARELAVELYA